MSKNLARRTGSVIYSGLSHRNSSDNKPPEIYYIGIPFTEITDSVTAWEPIFKLRISDDLGVLWSSVTEDSVELQSPDGTAHPVVMLKKVTANPNNGAYTVQLSTSRDVDSDDNGTWSLVSTATSVFDIDNLVFAPGSVITTVEINIPIPPPNDPPIIKFVGAPLPDIVVAEAIWQPTFNLNVSDPG